MLSFKDALFIFTTSPAGLGHIRVMDAIKEGRPGEIKSVDIGIINMRANRIHDLGSRIKLFVKITEFYQTNKIAEKIVTAYYTWYLRRHKKEVIKEFSKIASEYPENKVWVVISTHFALAHSISGAKEELENSLGIKIYLCVIVTDDSPQKIWAVPGSDITFVPSESTKLKLISFLPPAKQKSVKAIPFPISPRLTQNLTVNEFKFVIDQLNPTKDSPTEVVVPISGAAVQLDYFTKLVGNLRETNFQFIVVGQQSALSNMFFTEIQKMPHVQASIGTNAWQTVNLYESLYYQAKRPAIEITKPSEQAFKVIITPRQRGGVILLLTSPIGRQEYDNLNFLARYNLMPTKDEENALINEGNLDKYKEKAAKWRAICLPEDPAKAAILINKLKKSGIFYSMLNYVAEEKPELMSDGVSKIWDEIGKLI